VKVYMDYLPQGKDMIEVLGHQTKDAAIEDNHPGLQLINKSDCKACHAISKKSIGPAYVDVAKRYSKEEGAVERLAAKVIKGGGGNWGEQAMSAHPQLSVADASTMVSYILTLADEKKAKTSLEPQGSFMADQHVGKGEEGTYILSAYYTDKGGKEVGPLMSKGTMILRHPRLQAEDYDAAQGVSNAKMGDDNYVQGLRNNAYISFKGIDLKDIDKITYNYSAKDATGKLEMRIDSPKGKIVSTADIAPGQETAWKEASAAVNNPGGKHDLYFVFTNNQGSNGALNLNWIYFHNSKITPAKTQQRLSSR
jgi:cytochrome c